jgi:hypothetical protein
MPSPMSGYISTQLLDGIYCTWTKIQHLQRCAYSEPPVAMAGSNHHGQGKYPPSAFPHRIGLGERHYTLILPVAPQPDVSGMLN